MPGLHFAFFYLWSDLYPIHGDYKTDSESVKLLAKDYSISDEHCYLSDVEISESLPELTSLLNVSVIVMGAISRSRFDRMLIGNTAERVMDKLECDVLVIKPD